MEFAGVAHVTLTSSKYEECVKFYDTVLGYLGMKPYVTNQFARGWWIDEFMFVIVRGAQAGDHFSQFRVGLHHLSFRARSRKEVDEFEAMLKSIGAKITSPAEPGPFWPGYYSVVCEDPDGVRIEVNYIPAEGWKAVGEASDRIASGRA